MDSIDVCELITSCVTWALFTAKTVQKPKHFSDLCTVTVPSCCWSRNSTNTTLCAKIDCKHAIDISARCRATKLIFSSDSVEIANNHAVVRAIARNVEIPSPPVKPTPPNLQNFISQHNCLTARNIILEEIY